MAKEQASDDVLSKDMVRQLASRIAATEARVAELESELKRLVHSHDGTHAEDCRAFGAGSDEDLPEEPSDADPMCTCGATNERERARRVVQGKGCWEAKGVSSVFEDDSTEVR